MILYLIKNNKQLIRNCHCDFYDITRLFAFYHSYTTSIMQNHNDCNTRAN